MGVECGGCRKKKPEKIMMIYDVSTDKYFCNQQCKDKKDGIKRDKNGFVIAMK